MPYIHRLMHLTNGGRVTGNKYKARKSVLELFNPHRAPWKNKPRNNPLVGTKAAICTPQD
jgi:hypothetical protein